MSKLSSTDRRLWGGLIHSILDPKTGPAKIRREALRVGGTQYDHARHRRGKRGKAGAKMPDGHTTTASPFFKMVAVGKVLQANDAISRQLLCDYAHRCLRVLDPGPIRGFEISAVYLNEAEHVTPEVVEAVRRHRRDIDD